MADKCFCHLNGYKVKDADARAEIETIKEQIDNISPVDSEARAAAAAAQSAIDQHKAAEVIDSAARSSIVSLQEDLEALEGKACEDTTARSAAATAQATANEAKTAAASASTAAATAQATANEAKTAAGTNANSITGHETRITALESSGGIKFKEVTATELKALMTEQNVGKMVKFAITNKASNLPSGAFGVIGKLYAGGTGYGVYSGFAFGSGTFWVAGNIQVHTGTCSISGYQYTIENGTLVSNTLSNMTVRYFIEE